MFYTKEKENIKQGIRNSIKTEGVSNKTFNVDKSIERDGENGDFHTIELVLTDNKSNESSVMPLAYFIGSSSKKMLVEEKGLMMEFNEILYEELIELAET